MEQSNVTRAAGTMVIVFVAFAAMSFFLTGGSKNRIDGKVIDRSTGQTLEGVVVRLVGESSSDTTDVDGEFSFTGLKSGEYQLEIIHAPYAKLSINQIVIDGTEAVKLTVRLDKTKSLFEFASSAVNEQETVSLPPGPAKESKLFMALGAGAASTKSAADRSYASYGGLNPVNGQKFHDMFHTSYGTNPFIDTEDDRYSTFGADVSTGSLGLVRNYLSHGEIPPKEAYRVEEFVNYYPQDYAAPKKSVFAVYTGSMESPISKNTRLLRIGIKGREVEAKDRQPANLTFVIDVSGSMNMENRLGLVKETMLILLKQLKDGDRVGIVAYGSSAQIILKHTANTSQIEDAIRGLTSGGSTNAEAGLWEGYKLAADNIREGAINRVILCTDGVANNGETSSDGLLRTIEKHKKAGITLTACGFGMGNYNDVLIEQLATKGDGTYYYIDDLKEARRVFVEQLTGTLQVIAKDVKIQVEFDSAKVSRYRLLGYEKRDIRDEDFRDDKIDGGEIGSGHNVTALYEINTKSDLTENIGKIHLRYQSPDGSSVDEISELLSLKNAANNRDRFIGAVTLYAEIMRKSYWARNRDVKEVLDLLDNMETSFKRSYEPFEDFRDLVRTTIRLQEGKVAQGNE